MPSILQRILDLGVQKRTDYSMSANKEQHRKDSVPGFSVLGKPVPIHVGIDGYVVIGGVVVPQEPCRDPQWRRVWVNGLEVKVYLPTIRTRTVTHFSVGFKGVTYHSYKP